MQRFLKLKISAILENNVVTEAHCRGTLCNEQ